MLHCYHIVVESCIADRYWHCAFVCVEAFKVLIEKHTKTDERKKKGVALLVETYRRGDLQEEITRIVHGVCTFYMRDLKLDLQAFFY